MLRQRPARRLASLERLHRDLLARRRIGGNPRLSFGLASIFFHVGELQLKLLEMLRATLPTTIAIVEEIDPVPALSGDARELQQVVVNLVTNAAQAIGAVPGKITIAVKPDGDESESDIILTRDRARPPIIIFGEDGIP